MGKRGVSGGGVTHGGFGGNWMGDVGANAGQLKPSQVLRVRSSRDVRIEESPEPMCRREREAVLFLVFILCAGSQDGCCGSPAPCGRLGIFLLPNKFTEAGTEHKECAKIGLAVK